MERELERDGDQSQGEWEALSCRHMGGSETWREGYYVASSSVRVHR